MIHPDHNYHYRIPISEVDPHKLAIRDFALEVFKWSSKLTEIIIWLNGNVEYNGFSYQHAGHELDVWFLNERDMMAFALKFGNSKCTDQ